MTSHDKNEPVIIKITSRPEFIMQRMHKYQTFINSVYSTRSRMQIAAENIDNGILLFFDTLDALGNLYPDIKKIGFTIPEKINLDRTFLVEFKMPIEGVFFYYTPVNRRADELIDPLRKHFKSIDASIDLSIGQHNTITVHYSNLLAFEKYGRFAMTFPSYYQSHADRFLQQAI